jgi:hypothetical protein
MFEVEGERFMFLGEFFVNGKCFIEGQADGDDYTVAFMVSEQRFEDIVIL